MQPLQFLVPVGVLAEFEQVIPVVAFVLVLANIATRLLGHRKHRKQVENGDEDLGWYVPHLITSFLLVLVSFAYLIVEPHAGMVLSVLVVGTLVTDFFEVEARNVEARNTLSLEKPKAAVVASVFVLLYAGFQALFFLVEPIWSAIV